MSEISPSVTTFTHTMLQYVEHWLACTICTRYASKAGVAQGLYRLYSILKFAVQQEVRQERQDLKLQVDNNHKRFNSYTATDIVHLHADTAQLPAQSGIRLLKSCTAHDGKYPQALPTTIAGENDVERTVRLKTWRLE
jgi:hypothetical protein